MFQLDVARSIATPSPARKVCLKSAQKSNTSHFFFFTFLRLFVWKPSLQASLVRREKPPMENCLLTEKQIYSSRREWARPNTWPVNHDLEMFKCAYCVPSLESLESLDNLLSVFSSYSIRPHCTGRFVKLKQNSREFGLVSKYPNVQK